MSEPQIADALRSALDEETAGLTARPDAASLARRHGRRRRVARSLMASVPAVALAVGGAVLATHGTGTGSPTGSPAASHPAMLTAAYVSKQVQASLSSDKYIIQSTGTSATFMVGNIAFQFPGSGSTTNWDSVTGDIQSVEQSGQNTETAWITSDEVGNKPQVKLTVIYTSNKTVFTSTYPGSARLLGVAPATSPSQLKQALAKGKATIAGKSVIGGQHVLDLRIPTVDYWVNAKTFQLVKLVMDPTGGSAPQDTFTWDFRWLPRTQWLVSQVDTPHVPAGYQPGTGSK